MDIRVGPSLRRPCTYYFMKSAKGTSTLVVIERVRRTRTISFARGVEIEHVCECILRQLQAESEKTSSRFPHQRDVRYIRHNGH